MLEWMIYIQCHLGSIAIIKNKARLYETFSRRKYERSIENCIRPTENPESYRELFHELGDIFPLDIGRHEGIDIRVSLGIREYDITRELGTNQAKTIACHEPSLIHSYLGEHRAYAFTCHVRFENFYLCGGDHSNDR